MPDDRGSSRGAAATGDALEGLRRQGVDIDSAVEDSCLRELGPDVLNRLCAGAEVLRYSGGTEVLRVEEPNIFQPPGLLVEGLLRVVRRHASGREVTARFVIVGDLVGLFGVLGEDRPLALDAWLTTEVVHDTAVVAFNTAAVRSELDSEPTFGRALSRYLFAQLLAAQDALAGSLLLPVRSRVASNLLDLAERRDDELIVDASARRLAATAGSVREVISRVLREMESAGLIRRDRARLVLTDTAALHRLAAGEGS